MISARSETIDTVPSSRLRFRQAKGRIVPNILFGLYNAVFEDERHMLEFRILFRQIGSKKNNVTHPNR